MALAVVQGKTEEQIRLESELERERTARRNVELTNTQLADENQRLRAIPGAPKKRKAPLTFFDPPEDDEPAAP